MAYFWVSQNKTWKQESEGGYLWAPKADNNGDTPHHWATMLDVRPGDIIFSYVGKAIIATSIAASVAYDSPRPSEFRTVQERSWIADGLRIDVVYEQLANGLPIQTVREELLSLLPDKYSPL